jgi:hypothetical protein
MSLPPSFAVDLVLKVSGEEGAADAAEVEFKRGLDERLRLPLVTV